MEKQSRTTTNKSKSKDPKSKLERQVSSPITAVAEITDEMLLKAVSMANERDKEESRILKIQNRVIKQRPSTAAASFPISTTISSSNNKTVGGANGAAQRRSKMEYTEACPFDIICDFLQAVMQKKYEEAKDLCDKILQYEPENSTAIEFQSVLSEMVAESEDSSNSNDSSDESESDETALAKGDNQEINTLVRRQTKNVLDQFFDSRPRTHGQGYDSSSSEEDGENDDNDNDTSDSGTSDSSDSSDTDDESSDTDSESGSSQEDSDYFEGDDDDGKDEMSHVPA